jgi:hypothetical protein
MSGFFAVFRREVRIRRLVFVAAALAALIPFIVTLARGVHGDVAADERASIAFIVAIAFAFGMAVGLGASMAASAIANRQIAFDFARPLSSLDIAVGRAAAAWVLALGSAAIVMLPTLVVGGRLPSADFVTDPRLERTWPLVVCFAVLAILAAAHAVGVVIRSRSPLLAMDILLCGVAGLAIVGVLHRLPAFLAATPRWNVAAGLGIAAVVALVASGYASVQRGRTEIGSSHRALSAFFWSILGVSIAAAAAYAAWVRGARPDDLRNFWTMPAPRDRGSRSRARPGAPPRRSCWTPRPVGPFVRSRSTGGAPRSRSTGGEPPGFEPPNEAARSTSSRSPSTRPIRNRPPRRSPCLVTPTSSSCLRMAAVWRRSWTASSRSTISAPAERWHRPASSATAGWCAASFSIRIGCAFTSNRSRADGRACSKSRSSTRVRRR